MVPVEYAEKDGGLGLLHQVLHHRPGKVFEVDLGVRPLAKLKQGEPQSVALGEGIAHNRPEFLQGRSHPMDRAFGHLEIPGNFAYAYSLSGRRDDLEDLKSLSHRRGKISFGHCSPY